MKKNVCLFYHKKYIYKLFKFNNKSTIQGKNTSINKKSLAWMPPERYVNLLMLS